MSSVPQRLSDLRREMKSRGIDIYVVPTADFHGSEYVGEHFKARQFITGFTGSAGTAVITAEEAGLWTDARYFLQADAQLKDSGVTLYRMGEEGVPTLQEFLADPKCLDILAVLVDNLCHGGSRKHGHAYDDEQDCEAYSC